MGVPVIVYGKSGAGKSYSMKGFGPSEVPLCNCMGKPLPFKGRFEHTGKMLNATKILESVRKAITDYGCKSIVIDDAGYIMTAMFMTGHRDKRGGNQFDLYNDIGDSMWQLMRSIMALPEDVIVYLLMHESISDTGECRIRTIGRLLEDKVCLEGMCTIVIHAVMDENGHSFRVQASSGDVAKSPEGMFTSDTIPNNLKAVDEAIRAYYELSAASAN